MECDVLVASHDAAILRSAGVTLIQNLWSNDISAELARDSRSPEDLISQYRDDQHSWIVIIKQDSSLKVKSQDRKDVSDADMQSHQLMGWLKGEIREREQRIGAHQRAKVQRNSSHQDSNAEPENEQDVRVLFSVAKSKKGNRQYIVEQAQTKAAALTHEFLSGPIAAIETSDQILESIRGTRLSDPESWRQVTQAAPLAERRYIGNLHDLMSTLAHQEAEKKKRHSFIYNFRTQNCIYYDLGA